LGNRDRARVVGGRQLAIKVGYVQKHNLRTKVILLNDGPGLLLGSMWDDYSKLEESYLDKVMVLTLRMVPERLTLEWLQS
jgi:hypothetical protein